MTLIDGDKIVTAQLYDDEHEEFTEQKMSIIDYVNAYTDEGVTKADDVLDKIRAEIIEKYWDCDICKFNGRFNIRGDINDILQIIDKYRGEQTT